MSASSKELARWLRAWARRHGHDFSAANLGVSAAVCSRCDLVVTVRGKVFTDSHTWIIRTWGRRWDRLAESGFASPSYPSPSLLRHAVLDVLPRCGVPVALYVMEA